MIIRLGREQVRDMVRFRVRDRIGLCIGIDLETGRADPTEPQEFRELKCGKLKTNSGEFMHNQ